MLNQLLYYSYPCFRLYLGVQGQQLIVCYELSGLPILCEAEREAGVIGL